MTNRDLLKEAIADAKAVKETAIANAKAALEESFGSHLKELLAAKLEALDEEDESFEESKKAKEDDMMEEFVANEGKDGIEEEFDLNEILMELEEGEDKKEMYEEEAEEEMEAGEAEMEAGEEAEDMGEEEIDLEDMTEDDLKSFIEDVIADMVAAGELEAGEEMEAEMGDMEAEEEMGDMDMEALDEMDEVTWAKQNGKSLADLAPKKVGQTTSANGINLDESVEESIVDPNLMDMINQMEELKKELQEVNLLNAKLLYTNKIFNAKTLNESQKLRVLKAFDKATSVKEAKVIFETLNEGMVSKTTKSSMVNEIKSSASKATGVIRENRQPIVEVDPMVARWQKLAGIK